MPTNLKVFNHAVINNKLHNNFFLTDPDLRARFWPNEPPHLNLLKKSIKEDDSNTSNKDTFETLQIRKSKWTPPEGQFSSLDFFLKKCRHDINKLKFNRYTKFSNLSSEEWSALKSLKKRKDMVIKAADKGGAVWHLLLC